MKNFYPYFADEETEAQKGFTDLLEVTCLNDLALDFPHLHSYNRTDKK